MKRFGFLLVCLACIFALASCSDADTDASSKKPAQQPADPAGPSPESGLATEKWNTYVGMANPLNRYMSDWWQCYTGVFGNAAQLPENLAAIEKSPFSFFGDGYDAQVRSIDASLAMAEREPKSELDMTVSATLPVIKSFIANLQKAKLYYAEKRYMDDGYAEGRHLHTVMVQEAKAYEGAMNTLFEALQKRNRELQAEQLQRLKDEGRVIFVSAAETVNAVQSLNAFVKEQLATLQDFKTMDINAFKERYTALAQAVASLEAYCSDEEALTKEAFTSRQKINLKRLMTSAKRVKKEAATVIEKYEQPGSVSAHVRTPLKDMDSGCAQVVADFNYLVEN